MDIKTYINSLGNLDFRIKPPTPLFVEQKITPDVFSSVASIIIDYTTNNSNNEFTITEIYKSKECNEHFTLKYGKPDSGTSQHEYDKLAGQQPFNVMDFCGLLLSNRHSRSNKFQINNLKMLELVATSDLKSLDFLYELFYKVAYDSGFGKELDNLLDDLEKLSHEKAQESLIRFQNNVFYKFLENYTNKGRYNEDSKKYSVDRGRVIPKFINIFSVKKNLKGRIRGRLSATSLRMPDIIYNQKNWKDIAQGKQKSVSREFFNTTLPSKTNFIRGRYEANKITEYIKKITGGYSEVNTAEKGHIGHHILRKEAYPEFVAYPENIIYITGSDHQEVHKHGTSKIDAKETFKFLKAKLKSIFKNSEFYELKRFKEIINLSLNESIEELKINITETNDESEIYSIIEMLEKHYKDKGFKII